MSTHHKPPVRLAHFGLGLVVLLSLVWAFQLRPAFAGNHHSSEVSTRTPGITTRVSVASDGTQGNSYSDHPSISGDGRYVAFESFASNLVSDDNNDNGDIFVHDRTMRRTERASVASDGAEGNASSYSASISANGRYVAFYSNASNLVPDDTNSAQDIFVHDRLTGQTMRVSVASDGAEASGTSIFPSISGDGRYVAFDSYATNLVSDDSNGWEDIFVHDRITGQTTRMSVASDGTEANSSSYKASISANGRYVVFSSSASNLVSGDTGNQDVFVHDRATGQTTRVSIASDGTPGNSGSGDSASISANGRYVAFNSYASNLVSGDTNECTDYPDGHCGDIFVHDRLSGQTTRVSLASDGSQANDDSRYVSISARGRYVAFQSWATNLVGDDTNGTQDILVHDQATGQTTRVSVASDGTEGNSNSLLPSNSSSARFVAFYSEASNLVTHDTNGAQDVFVHDRLGAAVLEPQDTAQ